MAYEGAVFITAFDELEAPAIVMFSLWKTYVGPALGAALSMSYVEAIGYTLLGAGISVYLTLYFERAITRASRTLLASLPGRRRLQRPGFKASLRKTLRFYRRYGFWGLMLLTPVLVGLPIGVWLAVRLGSSRSQVGVTVMTMAFLWSSASYLVAVNGIEQLSG